MSLANQSIIQKASLHNKHDCYKVKTSAFGAYRMHTGLSQAKNFTGDM